MRTLTFQYSSGGQKVISSSGTSKIFLRSVSVLMSDNFNDLSDLWTNTDHLKDNSPLSLSYMTCANAFPFDSANSVCLFNLVSANLSDPDKSSYAGSSLTIDLPLSTKTAVLVCEVVS